MKIPTVFRLRKALALDGALYKPFQWWDSNPTGRVLNRFSADVEVMDKAVTNIFGIIIGAVLYFLGHTLVLTFASPMSIVLLPGIILRRAESERDPSQRMI